MDRTGTHIGGYELIRPIGRGGMAEVWVARRTGRRAGKYVAVKLITDAYAGDSRFKRMFRAEAEISALLNHANIVQVFDEGEEDGRSYLVMEWVDGVNLLKIEAALTFIEDEPWRLKITAYVIGQLLHALSYAHSVTMHDGSPLGIVHRDVTPQNVLISARGEVKLTDFGVAHHLLEQSSGTHVKGKIRYMAPEHLAGAQRDPRVDLYAVGAILHEMVDGRRFRHHVEDQRDMYAEVLSGSVPSVSRPIPPELDDLRKGLLERDPQWRIGTAEQALELLERYAGYGDARRDLTELCSTVTGVVRPRVGPGSSGISPVAERPATADVGDDAVAIPGGPAERRSAMGTDRGSPAREANSGSVERFGRDAVPHECRADVVSGELVDEDGQTVPQLPLGRSGAARGEDSPVMDDVPATVTRAAGAVLATPPVTLRSSEVTATSERETTMPGGAYPRTRSASSSPVPRQRRDVMMLGLTAVSVLSSAVVVSVLLVKPGGEVVSPASSARVPVAGVETQRNDVQRDDVAESREESAPAAIGEPAAVHRGSGHGALAEPVVRERSEHEGAVPGAHRSDVAVQEMMKMEAGPEHIARNLSPPDAGPPAARVRRTSAAVSPREPSSSKSHPLTIKVQVGGSPGAAAVRLDGGAQWFVDEVRTESIGEGKHRLEWKLPDDASWRRGPQVKVDGCGVIIDISKDRATYRPYKNCK